MNLKGWKTLGFQEIKFSTCSMKAASDHQARNPISVCDVRDMWNLMRIEDGNGDEIE